MKNMTKKVVETSINVSVRIGNDIRPPRTIKTTDTRLNLTWDAMKPNQRWAYVIRECYSVNDVIKNLVDGCVETNSNLELEGLVFTDKHVTRLDYAVLVDLEDLIDQGFAEKVNTAVKSAKAGKFLLRQGVAVWTNAFAGEDEED
jgi:hypothetical protein